MRTRTIQIDAVLRIPEETCCLAERLAEHRGCDVGDLLTALMAHQADGMVERLVADLDAEVVCLN